MDRKIRTVIYIIIAVILSYNTYEIYSIGKRIEESKKENLLKCTKKQIMLKDFNEKWYLIGTIVGIFAGIALGWILFT